MTNQDIIQIIKEASLAVNHSFEADKLEWVSANNRDYGLDELPELKRDIVEAARQAGLLMLEYTLNKDGLNKFLEESGEPVLLLTNSNGIILPTLVKKVKKNIEVLYPLNKNQAEKNISEQEPYAVFIIMQYNSIVSENSGESESGKKLSPARRLFNLLATEKKDIYYILIYALIIGLVSLALPLGLQTTVELISGGVFFSSVYVLVALVIVGVLITGMLQVVQISLVEHLQRRVFTKAAFEFAFRIPRIKMEALMKDYAPELVNRFFDIITLQKNLPKLLIDLSSGIIQVTFGLALLSLYHPFFVFFSFFLVGVILLVFYFTGPKGLSSALLESKYKYKVVQWLEELGRAINSFKLAGNTDLPLRRTDHVVNKYLKYRTAHFKILLTQFSSFVFIKVAVTAALLIMGVILVIDREITLGQFVASEVIIILVLNAVEKLIMYTDVAYDLLTAVDKVSHVTDLPLERSGGFDFPKSSFPSGYQIRVKDLYYKYPGESNYTLNGITFSVEPGEKICIAGPGGSGKTTLTNVVAGLYSEFEGIVSINQLSMRDIDITHLRDRVAKNISQDDIFAGSLYDNITIGKPGTKTETVLEAIKQTGLEERVDALPDGLRTQLLSGGKGISTSMAYRLILARCLAKRPALLILNDFFSGLSKSDKLELLRCVIGSEHKWTLLTVSNDPVVMASCDRVLIIDQGKLIADEPYQALVKRGIINQYFE